MTDKTFKCAVAKERGVTFYKYYSQATNRLVAYGVQHEGSKEATMVSREHFESMMETA